METNLSNEEKTKESMMVKIGNGFYNFFTSINKFRRSSFLSIIILIVMFLLIKGLDQAYTLLVDMIEDDASWSLILCYVIISVFALVISHYPIYIYYAKDINDSKDENYWYAHVWLKFYKIFTFSKKPTPQHQIVSEYEDDKKEYKQDYMAKYFRYSLGLLIFSIWTYYIYKTYEPKLFYAYDTLDGIWWWNLIFYGFPFLAMSYMLTRKHKVEKENALYKKEHGENSKAYEKFYTFGVISFYSITVISIILLLLIAFWASFNTTSYFLLQFLTLSLSLNYISFRLFRSKLDTYASIRLVKYIEVNFNYVVFFFIIALCLLGLIIYSNIAVAYDWHMPNAMVILFSYFYIIYYGLACVLKYLFVVQAIKRQSEAYSNGNIDEDEYLAYSGLQEGGISRLIQLSEQEKFVKKGQKKTVYYLAALILVVGISMFIKESPVHELDTCESRVDAEVLHMNDYINTLKTKLQKDKPLIFVASHGGALKANIWTMKLLNHIQKVTDGEFLNQTASFSGASGGMMGLSMYAVLAGKFPKNTEDCYKNIADRIDAVALKNYASMDVSYTLGWDFLRKAILFRYFSQHKDRSYYSMVSYRNLLENRKNDRKLDTFSFQNYWKDSIYDENKYFPAILVNTAKTNGRRGVFSSVRYDQKETDLFLNADNLAQLQPIEADGKRPVISFYQAVSCTNRFPGLSPAAKITGYGHYIDAGAIDNSGLLTSLDWYDRLKNMNDFVIKPETNVIFVEVINGKSNYIKYLVEEFKKKAEIDFIVFNEKEQGNLSAVISAGANLDKNPDYFSDLIKRLEKRGRKPVAQVKDSLDAVANSKKYRVKHLPIYLPRIITIKDVESFIGGVVADSIKNSEGKKIGVKAKLIDYLSTKNKEIYAMTEDTLHKTEWETYEPTLARHLSPSTLLYYDKILSDSTSQIQEKVKFIKKALKL
ncbi:hypothetical protein [uncultured Kordia sp.]|uniref:hypothetical protein n=1 Tax=uncultured Kordia sp. TaxID=507699 RepID=UPI00261DCB8A|nr:hypothetical protein [uncultured Kordia sp.]